jgi:membrane protein implicated in regulation of membrane protease activity
MADELSVLVTGIVAGAAIMPGFFLTVPGLILVVAPLVAIALLAAATALVVLVAAAPVFLGLRLARRIRRSLPLNLTTQRTMRPSPVSAQSMAR